MRSRILATAVALAAATLTAHPPVSADTGTAPGLALMTTTEDGCFEVLTQRAVTTAEVDLLVPDRFGLPSTPVMTLFIHTYTCRNFLIDGHLQVGHDKTTTVTIGSVNVTSIDGQATAGFNGYLLWYGTDNPVQFAKLRRVGVPATFLPGSTVSLPDAPRAGDAVAVEWAVRGDGLDYDLRIDAIEPMPTPATSVIRFLHDAANGNRVRIAIQNEESGQVQASSTHGQLAGIDLLQDLLTDPRFNTIPLPGAVARFPYIRGSWSSEVTVD